MNQRSAAGGLKYAYIIYIKCRKLKRRLRGVVTTRLIEKTGKTFLTKGCDGGILKKLSHKGSAFLKLFKKV